MPGLTFLVGYTQRDTESYYSTKLRFFSPLRLLSTILPCEFTQHFLRKVLQLPSELGNCGFSPAGGKQRLGFNTFLVGAHYKFTFQGF